MGVSEGGVEGVRERGARRRFLFSSAPKNLELKCGRAVLGTAESQ